MPSNLSFQNVNRDKYAQGDCSVVSGWDRDPFFIRYVHMCLRGHCVYVGCDMVELCQAAHTWCVSVCAFLYASSTGEDLTDSAGVGSAARWAGKMLFCTDHQVCFAERKARNGRLSLSHHLGMQVSCLGGSGFF